MPTADATLLPPPYYSTDSSGDETRERGSVRHLEEVGVGRVLGAMIEQKQRRASQPSYPAVSEIDQEPASERAPTRSEVFLKAR